MNPRSMDRHCRRRPSLVKTRGAEIGLRTKLIPQLDSSVSLFLLDSASEILFSGDAGDTEASRPSRRYGIEWTNDYRPLSWLSLQSDLAVTHARFRGDDPSRRRCTRRWRVTQRRRSATHPATIFPARRT